MLRVFNGSLGPHVGELPGRNTIALNYLLSAEPFGRRRLSDGLRHGLQHGFADGLGNGAVQGFAVGYDYRRAHLDRLVLLLLAASVRYTRLLFVVCLVILVKLPI